jgi:transposase, IS6 family
MSDPSLFKWRHFEAAMILCAVRWYLRYALSYRDVEELPQERGVRVDHTTVFRWAQRYAPELDKRCRPCLRSTNSPYCVDKTSMGRNNHWNRNEREAWISGDTRPDSYTLPLLPAGCREKHRA